MKVFLKCTRWTAVAAVMVFGLAGVVASCDSTAKFTPRSIRFAKVEAIGAVGASGDDLTESCRQTKDDHWDGLAINFSLLSTLPADASDVDVALRPGDRVERMLIGAPGMAPAADTAILATDNPKCVDVAFQCIEPLPDPDRVDPQPECSGPTTTPSGERGNVSYVSHTADSNEMPVEGRRRPVAVVLLIDQSGSLNGYTVATCEDELPATLDTCGEDGRCVHTCPRNPCDDGSSCTDDTCDSGSGTCTHTCKAGASPDECGHICGLLEQGTSASVTGCESQFDCIEAPSDDQCTDDVCDNGRCRHVERPGSGCNVRDCSSEHAECPAACTSPADCDDHDANTENLCADNRCVYRNTTLSYLGCYPESPEPPQGIVSNLGSLASDAKGARIAAAKTFIGMLNQIDLLLVMEYSESNGIKVVCDPGDDAVTGDLKPTCFGINRSFVMTAAGGKIQELQGNEYGRTPLWSAVEEAWQFLADPNNAKARGAAARHIVVIGDGPDTCASGDFLDPKPGLCSTSKTYHDVLCRMRPGAYDDCPQRGANNEVLTDSDVHVSFVQFQAVGYEAPDPHQIEMSCMTRGQYQFVNNLDFSQRERETQLQAALTEALSRIRHSLAGFWTVKLPFDPIGDSPGTSVLRGKIYSLKGYLRLLGGKPTTARNEGCGLSQDTFEFQFNVGFDYSNKTDTAVPPNWDQRLLFAKQCDPAAPDVCADYDPLQAPCRQYCSEDQRLCIPGGLPKPNSDNQTCALANGDPGKCCQGFCQADVCP